MSASCQYATFNLDFYILSYTFFKLHFRHKTHRFIPLGINGEPTEGSLKVPATNGLAAVVTVTHSNLAKEAQFESEVGMFHMFDPPLLVMQRILITKVFDRDG